MQATIQKWGNSQGIRIPKAYLDAVGMAENDCVVIERSNDSIIIKKMAEQPEKLTLDDIFSGYSGECESEKFEWGSPIGKEVW